MGSVGDEEARQSKGLIGCLCFYIERQDKLFCHFQGKSWFIWTTYAVMDGQIAKISKL